MTYSDVVHSPWGDVPENLFSAGMTQQDVYDAQAMAGMPQGQTLLQPWIQDNDGIWIPSGTTDIYQDNRYVETVGNPAMNTGEQSIPNDFGNEFKLDSVVSEPFNESQPEQPFAKPDISKLLLLMLLMDS